MFQFGRSASGTSGFARSMLETLERRRLLSGNVTAVFDAGSNTVVVRGDNKANDILIAPDLGTGYIIKGRNGTTINGAPSADVGNGAINNFNIETGNGDDVVEFGEGFGGSTRYVVGNLDIGTGNGGDSVKLILRTTGNLDINTGNGGDDVSMKGSQVQGNLSIDTGNGADSIAFGAHLFGEVFVDGTTSIDGGHGPDVLTGLAQLHTTGTQVIDDIESIS